MAHERLLGILEDLDPDELDQFHWSMRHNSNDKIKKKHLKDSETRKSLTREATVDLLVQTYTEDGAVHYTKRILKKINQNELAEKLPDAGTGAKGGTATQQIVKSRGESEEKLVSVQMESSELPDLQKFILGQLLASNICRSYEELELVTTLIRSPEKARLAMDIFRDKVCSDTLKFRISVDMAVNFTPLQLPDQDAPATLQNLTNTMIQYMTIHTQWDFVRNEFIMSSGLAVARDCKARVLKAILSKKVVRKTKRSYSTVATGPPAGYQSDISMGTSVEGYYNFIIRQAHAQIGPIGGLESLPRGTAATQQIVTMENNAEEMGCAIHEMLTTAQVDMVRKRGNKAGLEMTDMVHQLKPNIMDLTSGFPLQKRAEIGPMGGLNLCPFGRLKYCSISLIVLIVLYFFFIFY